MPGIAMPANEERLRMEEILAKYVQLEGLTKLVALDTGNVQGIAFSSAWHQMSREDRRRILNGSFHDRFHHVEEFLYPKRLTTSTGESPRIAYAYTPMTVLLIPEDDETYQQLKERIEHKVMKVVTYIREKQNGIIKNNRVDAYYVGELAFEHRVPLELQESIFSCTPIAGTSYLSRKPANEYLFPRWKFDLSLFALDTASP